MNEIIESKTNLFLPRKNKLKRALSLTLWSVPIFMSLIGLLYTFIEHQRHVNDPAWPWPTYYAVIVLGIVGPLISWAVLHWSYRTATAYLVSQEQLANRAEELAAINQLTIAASRSVVLDERIETILKQSIDALNADAGMVFIQNNGQPGLSLKAHFGISKNMAEEEAFLQPGHCLCGHAVESRTVLSVNNIGDDPRCTSDLCICEGFRSVACGPLSAKGQLVGLLQLASLKSGHFSKEQYDFLATAAAQASVSIENARLYDQVRSFNVELEQKINQRTSELEAARWDLTEKARRLQRLLSESYRIQEDTQIRIAHDMHDGVTQMIIGALYETEAARNTLYDNPDKAIENLTHAQEHLTEVEREIRRVIYDLHPPVLDMMGLVIALKRYASNFSATFNIECEVEVTGNPCRLTKETEIAIYRIIQSALQNVASHAQASQTRVLFKFESDQLLVKIIDNGNGFDPDSLMKTPGDHLGLIGMKERSEGLGAELKVNSQKGHGTQVALHLPSPAYIDK